MPWTNRRAWSRATRRSSAASCCAARPEPVRLLYVSYNTDSDGGGRRAAHYAEFHAGLKTKYARYGQRDAYFR